MRYVCAQQRAQPVVKRLFHRSTRSVNSCIPKTELGLLLMNYIRRSSQDVEETATEARKVDDDLALEDDSLAGVATWTFVSHPLLPRKAR